MYFKNTVYMKFHSLTDTPENIIFYIRRTTLHKIKFHSLTDTPKNIIFYIRRTTLHKIKFHSLTDTPGNIIFYNLPTTPHIIQMFIFSLKTRAETNTFYIPCMNTAEDATTFKLGAKALPKTRPKY